MPYATGRVYNDADAHIMEPADWLASYADAKTRALLKPLDLAVSGNMAEHAFKGKFAPSHWDEVDIEKNLMFIKGWESAPSIPGSAPGPLTCWVSIVSSSLSRSRWASSGACMSSASTIPTYSTAARRRSTARSRTSARTTRG